MNLLSINYLHAGAPKYWYSISPSDEARFESLACSFFPDASHQCRDFLRHKRYLVSPHELRKAGIKYSTQIQRPGDAVITFPGSYHFGFNTGFNVAESTNFAVEEWVPTGLKASVCQCHPHSVRIDMNRFNTLLSRYGKACAAQGERLSYIEWAKETVRARKEEARRAADDDDPDGDTVASKARGGSKAIGTVATPGKTIRLKVIENSPKKKRARKNNNIQTVPTWKWTTGQRGRPRDFSKGTDVLCMLDCAGGVVGDAGIVGSVQRPQAWFVGTVREVNEGYCRVHFLGLQKKSDIWVHINSETVMLNLGEAYKFKEQKAKKAPSPSSPSPALNRKKKKSRVVERCKKQVVSKKRMKAKLITP